jgi:hypothetical protein
MLFTKPPTRKATKAHRLAFGALLLLAHQTAAEKVDWPYCNNAMDTGAIPPLAAGADLVQVTVLHRHGARTGGAAPCWPEGEGAPLAYNCTSAVLEGPDAGAAPGSAVLFRKVYARGRNELRGGCGLQQLVGAGVAQCAASGRLLKARYAALLPASPVGSEAAFQLRSDDCPRTLASGQALFAAMYPGVGAVVPWLTMDAGGDAETMFPNPNVCPALTAAVEAADARFAASAHYAAVTAPLLREVSAALGRNVSAGDELGRLLDCTMSVQCASVPSSGGEPPAAFTRELQRRVVDEVAVGLYAACNDSTASRFGAGPLLGEVLGAMERAVGATTGANTNASDGASSNDASDDASYAKFVVLSGHDTGPMAPVLGALRVGGARFPVFNDLLAIELYRVQQQQQQQQQQQGGGDAPAATAYAVRLVHNGAVVTQLVPGCEAGSAASPALCPWGAFHATVAARVPTPAECGRSDSPPWWPVPQPVRNLSM